MKILFVAFEFPPLNRGGVFRPYSFVKYLQEFGIIPIVVTLAEESYSSVYDQFVIDRSIAKDLPMDTKLFAIEAENHEQSTSRLNNFINIYFSIHGREVKKWEKNFIKQIDQIISEYKPTAILATVPPFSVLPLVYKTSVKFKLPLILDFRDAWSQWRTMPYGTILHYKLALSFERKYLSHCSAVIATSLQTIEDFKELHPGIPENKYNYIPNGFNGQLMHWKGLDTTKEKITIGYVGTFYYNPEARDQMLTPWWKKKAHRKLQYIPQKQDWLYRTPFFFFKTLQQLKKSNPELYAKICVKFVGKKQDWLLKMIREFGLDDVVHILGQVSHDEAIRFQQECDLLFITSAKRIGGNDYSIAGKTFEYIQSGKPILAFVAEGAQKDILSEAGTALICDPDDIKGSTELFSQLLCGRSVLVPNYNFIETLRRDKLTSKLADIIRRVVKTDNELLPA